MLVITIFVGLTLIVGAFLDAETEIFYWYKAGINLSILALQGDILRQYIWTAWNFLQLMKQHHHYEYQRHVVRETVLFVLLSISFVF